MLLQGLICFFWLTSQFVLFQNENDCKEPVKIKGGNFSILKSDMMWVCRKISGKDILFYFI